MLFAPIRNPVVMNALLQDPLLLVSRIRPGGPEAVDFNEPEKYNWLMRTFH